MAGADYRVRVFVPYARERGKLVSPYYETAEFREDVSSWMRSLGLEWAWVGVEPDSVGVRVAEAAARSRDAPTMVLNFCDGDDINGYPGLRVVEALEAAGVGFTGADAAFFRLSTSKMAMKRRFLSAGVPTAAWIEIRDPDADIDRAIDAIGLPLFLKPDVGFGAAGISLRSVLHSRSAAIDHAAMLYRGVHGLRVAAGGILAEPFIQGSEYTVLLRSDAADEGGVRVFVPCERVFNPNLPVSERYLTFERYCEEYDQDTPPPSGSPYYRYATVVGDLGVRLQQLARSAFFALGGNGYARVDIRRDDAAGALLVLEVNANCAISTGDTSSAGTILLESGESMIEFIAAILAHGWRRHRRSQGAAARSPA